MAQQRSFGVRVIWIVTPVLLAIFVGLGMLGLHELQDFMHGQYAKRGETLVRDIAAGAELGVFAEDPVLLASTLRSVVGDDDVGFIAVYDERGVPLALAGSDRHQVAESGLDLSRSEEERLAAGASVVVRRGGFDESPHFEFLAPITTRPGELGDRILIGPLQHDARAERKLIGYVRLGLTHAAIDADVAQLAKVWWGVSLLALLLVSATLYFASRWLTGPVRDLTRHAEAMAEGDFTQRVPVVRNDEVGLLADSFNRMATRLGTSTRERARLLNDLQELNESLEQRISRRTSELEARTEELEQVNAHRSQFLANMSHELRTPLNAIIGYGELLAEDLKGTADEKQLEDIRTICSSGRHLLSLINDLLDLSKIEAGRIELFHEDFDVSILVSEAIGSIRPIAAQSGNSLTIDLDPRLGEMRGDSTRLRQCLLNLLSNACKFTEKGTIRVTTELQHDGDEPWVRIDVSDSGIGIEEEKLTKIFDAFRQADASTTRRFGGTGLGLTISRSFCRMMGGDLTATSVPGAGSVFTICVPRFAAETSAISTGVEITSEIVT